MTAGSVRVVGDRGRRKSAIAIALAIFALLAIALHAPAARADNVDELIRQLDDSSDKVRLSATLNLTKLGDPRALLPMIKRLSSDSDKNVRGAAAKGIGALIKDNGSKVKSSIRSLAVKALEKAASTDDSDFVTAQARLALTELGADPGPGAGSGSGPRTNGGGGSGGVYVNIGPMSSKTGSSGDDSKFRATMVKVATKTMGKAASNMPTTWPGGVPSKADLDQKGVQGFFIDGTLTEMKVDSSGSMATVSCKVNMLLASFPDKSMFGFLNGGAKVQGSSSPSDIALAREDCVSAVVEDLIAKKIVPTIKSKAGIP